MGHRARKVHLKFLSQGQDRTCDPTHQTPYTLRGRTKMWGGGVGFWGTDVAQGI